MRLSNILHLLNSSQNLLLLTRFFIIWKKSKNVLRSFSLCLSCSTYTFIWGIKKKISKEFVLNGMTLLCVFRIEFYKFRISIDFKSSSNFYLGNLSKSVFAGQFEFLVTYPFNLEKKILCKWLCSTCIFGKNILKFAVNLFKITVALFLDL